MIRAPSTLYRFAGRWRIDVPVDRLHERLVDLEHYPQWWPEVRAVAKVGPDDARVLVRSRLPYTLDLYLHAVHRLPDLLQTSISGDLVGWVRWRLVPDGAGALLSFEQEVEVGSRWLGLASYVARPLLVWNHEQMLRSAICQLSA
ncbi:SRPBCC family protein [Nocardioides sp. AE5]|uniref:SRPBCC family protein n=1 Tax=Nocardioides sp. AE5 TaxID=2962573 RepID=UPI00288238EC|nr:SRPBCC family protein [Nocardioides sp. AE5]MDT0201945.1 polyketide cyclase [Nocardioides sp. AE5]